MPGAGTGSGPSMVRLAPRPNDPRCRRPPDHPRSRHPAPFPCSSRVTQPLNSTIKKIQNHETPPPHPSLRRLRRLRRLGQPVAGRAAYRAVDASFHQPACRPHHRAPANGADVAHRATRSADCHDAWRSGSHPRAPANGADVAHRATRSADWRDAWHSVSRATSAGWPAGARSACGTRCGGPHFSDRAARSADRATAHWTAACALRQLIGLPTFS